MDVTALRIVGFILIVIVTAALWTIVKEVENDDDWF